MRFIHKISVITVLCAVFFVFTACLSKTEKNQNKKELAVRKNARDVFLYVMKVSAEKKSAIHAYVLSLPLEQRTAQLFVENLTGCTSFIPAEKGSGHIPGGYIFFSYNIAQTPLQNMAFTDSINTYCVKNGAVPPFLALDQEGGYVNRLKNISGPLPSEERVALSLSPEQAFQLYSLQAVQMKALGFHMNLAPVAEVCTEQNAAFLDGRSFGAADAVALYGAAAVNGYASGGIAAVLKHFPGNTNTDPHTGLPEIPLSAAGVENTVVVPFRNLFAYDAAAVLMSHARMACADEKIPACLSRFWVTETLRNRMGFTGLVFSDDIFMGALADNGYPPEKAAVMAVEAGVDCILISEKKFAEPAAVLVKKALSDKAFEQKINEACERVVQYKIKYGILSETLQNGVWRIAAEKPCGGETYAVRLSEFEKAKKLNEALYSAHFKTEGSDGKK